MPGSRGDLNPDISPDGRFLAFVRTNAGQWHNKDVWVQPAGGGEARRLTFGHGLYYATTENRIPVRRERLSIHYRDFATGRTTPLLDRDEGTFHGGVAVSPDEKWIPFAEAPPWQADLVLIENFH